MQIVEKEVASGQNINLDDKHFMNCRFKECKLTYSGGDFMSTETAFENCQILLAGAAQRTAVLLTGFGVIAPGGLNFGPAGNIGGPKKPDGTVQ